MLYITSLCSAKKKIATAVEELASLGFRNIELTGSTDYYEGIQQDLVYLRDKFKLNYLVHNYFPPQAEEFVINLASADRKILQKNVELIKQAICYAKKFGTDLYCIHPGFLGELVPIAENGYFQKLNDNEDARENFYRTIKELLAGVVGKDFKLAIENLCPKNRQERYSLMCDQEEMEGFLDHFKDNPNIGILLDLGHLKVSANILEFDKFDVLDSIMRKYRDRIFEIHVSDNDGLIDAHKETADDTWQVDFLVNNIGFFQDIPIVFEWQRCASREIFQKFSNIQKKLAGNSD